MTLHEIGLKYNTDKATFHKYLDFYEQHLSLIKKSKGNFLELGVNDGASLKMWQEWLPNLKVEGWDIKPSDISNTKIVDCGNVEQLSKAAGKRKFKCVIDDASHLWADQINAFNILWPQTDIYIIEDLHTAIRKDYNKGGVPPCDSEMSNWNLDFSGLNYRVETFKGKQNDSWTAIFFKLK